MICSLEDRWLQRPRALTSWTLCSQIGELHRFSTYMARACMLGPLLDACICTFFLPGFGARCAESLHRRPFCL